MKIYSDYTMALTWKTFDPKNIVFEKVKVYDNGDIKFQRIFIKYRYPRGGTDKLSIQTPELFSWGVQENTMPMAANTTATAKPVDSYTMSFVMHDQNDEPTEDEKQTIAMFNTILNQCKLHLKKVSTKQELKKYQMDPFVDVMDIFYRKKDEGVVVAGLAPVLYCKLLTQFEKNRDPSRLPTITTGFFDRNDDPIDPLTLQGKRCKVIGDIVIDNIYVGAKPSIQVRLNDVIVTEQFARKRRLVAANVVRQLDDEYSLNDRNEDAEDELDTDCDMYSRI